MSQSSSGEEKARELLDRPARVPPLNARPEGHTDTAAGGEDSSPHETDSSGDKQKNVKEGQGQ